MSVYPLYINTSREGAPELPQLEAVPPEVRYAFGFLAPYENRLTDDELLRCISKIFSLSHSLFSDLPIGTLVHFPSTQFDTSHAFSLIKPEEELYFIYVHFNKKADGHKKEKGSISLSPTIDILHGDKSAWITPTKNDPFTYGSFSSQFPFFSQLNPSPNGIINSLCIQEVRGKNGSKPALLQEWGECDLWDYLHDRQSPSVTALIQKTSHLNEYRINLRIMHSLLIGLVKIHSEGIIHNDVKPGNVILLLNREDKSIQAKFIDFNSSVQSDEGAYISDPLGTYGYLPPEFYFYAEELSPDKTHPLPDSFSDDFPGYSPSKDVWALGHVFHELYFELPIDPRSEVFEESITYVKSGEPAHTLQEIERLGEIEGLIARMMHQNPTRRLTAEQALDQFVRIF